MNKSKVLKILKERFPGADKIELKPNGTYIVELNYDDLDEQHWFRVQDGELRRIGGVEIEV
jgi:hypothetical protein